MLVTGKGLSSLKGPFWFPKFEEPKCIWKKIALIATKYSAGKEGEKVQM
jgi:hypothetical protein